MKPGTRASTAAYVSVLTVLSFTPTMGRSISRSWRLRNTNGGGSEGGEVVGCLTKTVVRRPENNTWPSYYW